MKVFISPKLTFLYRSLSIYYKLNTHYTPPPLIFLLNILPLLAYSYLVNLPDISAMTNFPPRSSCSHPLCYIWSDPLATIRFVCYDPTQLYLIFSLLFDKLNLIFYDYLYFYHSNPIQSACSLFPNLISPLCSLELLILLKITYH